MSSSPRLDTVQPDPSLRSPATAVAAPSPSSGDARLVTLLSDTIRDRDELARELTAAKKRAEKAERLLATFTQSNSAPSGNGGPSNTLFEYEARIEIAEIARDETEAKRRVLIDNCAQFERHLQVLEIHASEARYSFSRMLLDGSNQLVLPNIHLPSTPLFTSQPALHQALNMPPPTHTSRHHIPSSRSSSLRSSVPISHSSAPFSNIPLPPPPNPKLYPHTSRVRPRASSTDGSVGVPGQPPAKKSRGDRSREYDGDRRAREDRAMFTESPIDSPHLHVAQTQPYHLSPQFSNPPPSMTAQTAHSIHIQHRSSDLDREDYHQRLRDQVNDHRHRAIPHDPANTVMRPGLLPGGAHPDRRSRRHRHPHSRSGSVGSRSSSRSSASSLSLDEMLLQATTGADNLDRRGAGNGPNGSVTGAVPTLPPAALRQHASHHRQRIPNSATQSQSDLGYPQPNSRLRPDSPLSDYRSHPSSRPRAIPHHQSQSQPTLMTGPGMNPEGGVGPLSQPGQVQTYQTHVFAPVVTGAPVKKNKFMGSAANVGGASPVAPGMSPGSGATAHTSAAAPGVIAEAVPQPTSFPPTNAQGQRICRQCGLPGRYKDGKCVEKWGPGPHGSGTVCDRCRKKMKRVERRGTLEGQQNASHHSMSSVVPPPIRRSTSHSRNAPLAAGQGSDRAMHRSDTILVPSPSGQLGPGGTHLLSPESSYVQHDRSPPHSKNARGPPPSPPAIATLDDGDGPADATTAIANQHLAPASRAQSRSNSRNGRPGPGGRRLSATPTVPSEALTNRPIPSSKRRSPLGSDPSRGSRSTGGSPQMVAEAETAGPTDLDADAEPDADAEAEVEADVDAEVDAEAEPEADVDADADAEAELLEAVDAAEANSSGSHGASGWLKTEDV